MRKRTFARDCALKILYQAEMTKRPIKAAAEQYWQAEDPEDLDKADFTPEVTEFTHRLVLGVSDHWDDIDSHVSKYATNWQLKRMAVIDRNILRLGVFELMYAPDIPPKVSINEAVELAKKYGDVDSSKFVNGILDKIHKTELNSQKPS